MKTSLTVHIKLRLNTTEWEGPDGKRMTRHQCIEALCQSDTLSDLIAYATVRRVRSTNIIEAVAH